MAKLDEIFQMENDEERLEALLEYARSLKLNFLKAKKDDGTYSENELAVLIHTAEETKKKSVAFGFGFFILAFMFLVVMVALILVFVMYIMPKG